MFAWQIMETICASLGVDLALLEFKGIDART
jgi:hypothetical protein